MTDFKVISAPFYGRSAAGYRKNRRRHHAGKTGADPDGCHRVRQDLHHGQDHREDPEVDASHKILEAQLHDEFKEFFPENAVEYFVL